MIEYIIQRSLIFLILSVTVYVFQICLYKNTNYIDQLDNIVFCTNWLKRGRIEFISCGFFNLPSQL